MRKLAIFLVLALLIGQVSADESGPTSTALSAVGTNPDLVHELFSDWQAITLIAIMLSAMLVSLAYMLGIGFEIPSLKAWAGTELGQVIASAIIVLTLWVLMGIIDFNVALVVNSSVASVSQGMPSCMAVGEPCLKDAAVFYLDGYIASAKSAARAILVNNMDAANKANKRDFFSCSLAIYPLPCMQYSSQSSNDAYLVLDVDKNTLLFENYASLLSSMEAQEFFVKNICFLVGPYILALGILARTFFMTRKLGGLLIAAAAALLFVLPLMYMFNWMTLNLDFSGDKEFGSQASMCPEECSAMPPLVYDANVVGGKNFIYSSQDLYGMFYDAKKDPLITKNLTNGIIGTYDWKTELPGVTPSKGPPDPMLTSCQSQATVKISDLPADSAFDYSTLCAKYVDNSLIVQTCGSQYQTQDASGNTVMLTIDNASIECPYFCRELPYPYVNSLCAPPIIQKACAKLPEICKVSRKATLNTLSNHADDDLSCVQECRVVPPLNNSCDVGNCLESRADCRVSMRNDTNYRITLIGQNTGSSDSNMANESLKCSWASECPASLVANESCTWVLPRTPQDCKEICPSCPSECRVTGMDGSEQEMLPDSCYSDSSKTTLIDSCSSANCPDSCKIPIQRIKMLDPTNIACKTSDGSSQCRWGCRVAGTSSVPTGCDQTACSLNVCGGSFRETVPSSSCQKCLDVEANFHYDPAVLRNCADYCAPQKNPTENPVKPLTMNGFVGGGDYQNIAQLMIQAYLLPLFDFAVTLMFVRSFSGMLGGDIELPGVSKVI